MLSSQGNASVAPRPLNIVRRERCFLVMIMTCYLLFPCDGCRGGGASVRNCSHREWSAPDNSHDQRGPPIVVFGQVSFNLADCGCVGIVNPAVYGVSQEFLGHGSNKLIASRRKQSFSKFIRALYRFAGPVDIGIYLGALILLAPLSRGIEMFQCKTERIHGGMAGRTHRILTMLFHP